MARALPPHCSDSAVKQRLDVRESSKFCEYEIAELIQTAQTEIGPKCTVVDRTADLPCQPSVEPMLKFLAQLSVDVARCGGAQVLI